MNAFGGLEVKCANCNEFFRLDQVVSAGDGYYCRKCYRHLMGRKDGPPPGLEERCAACGRTFAPGEARVQDGGKSYCPACYNQGPALEERRGAVQRRLDALNEEQRKAVEEKLKGYRNDADGFIGGFIRSSLRGESGPTILRDADRLAECKNCGWITEREGIDGAMGKAVCPRCGKRGFAPLFEVLAARKKGNGEIHCETCGRVLTPFDTRVQDGGRSYCPECYDKNKAYRHCGTGGEGADGGIACANCGNVVAEGDAWARCMGRTYCLACYDRLYPDLYRKGFPAQEIVETLRSAHDGERVQCAGCDRDLGPADVVLHSGGQAYCEKCFAEARKPAGEKPAAKPEKAAGKPEKAKNGNGVKEDFALTAQLFKCLGDPCRVKIIESLSEKELCVFEFVDITGYQYSAISYHLKMLKEMGVISSFERGNFMVYSLTDKGQVVHEFIVKSRALK